MLSHTIFTHTTKQKTKENLNADYGMKKKTVCSRPSFSKWFNLDQSDPDLEIPCFPNCDQGPVV